MLSAEDYFPAPGGNSFLSSSIFRACSGGVNPSHISSHFCLFQYHLSLTPSLPSFFIFKDSVGKIGPTQIIQAKLSISKSLTFIASAKSLFPCQVMYPQASWIRCGHPWGPLMLSLFPSCLTSIRYPQLQLLHFFHKQAQHSCAFKTSSTKQCS